jgi:hypothetical protein
LGEIVAFLWPEKIFGANRSFFKPFEKQIMEIIAFEKLFRKWQREE